MQVCSASQPFLSTVVLNKGRQTNIQRAAVLYRRVDTKRRDNCYVDTVIPKKNLYANSFLYLY